ncbi:uncharacterized protein At2g29880-like [Apium graveolens]|uniref:uncharacterized protein At2g29880-like n=1 Tax=Apium graveolens TaxID=4045 RepID=UPI003D7A1FAD
MADSQSAKKRAVYDQWTTHPKDGNLRYETFDDYEDLKNAIGNGFAVGKNAIGLGSSTEARTLEVDEVRDLRIDDLNFYVDSEGFVLEQNGSSPMGSPEVFLRSLSIIGKREQERTYTAWDAIKEIPNIDEDNRLEVLNLLDTKTKKDCFMKMTLEERAKWIHIMMSKHKN